MLFVGLVILFLVTRCAFLDRDLPPNGISNYVVLDEQFYTIPAFDWYNTDQPYNTFDLSDEYSLKYSQPINVLQNLMTYVSLLTFGNNYYGLRMASVVAALVSFILLFIIFSRIMLHSQKDRTEGELQHHYYLLLFFMAYLLSDFAFLMASRVAEPTIFRLMALTIVMYVGSMPRNAGSLESERCYSALLGFLCMAVVLFVYVYTLFIFAAMIVTVGVLAYRKGIGNTTKQFAYFLLGSLLCLIFYQWFIGVTYHSSIVDVFQYMTAFETRLGVGSSLTESIGLFLINLLSIGMTNVFKYNVVLIFAFLVVLPVFLHKLKTQKTKFDILLFNLLLFLGLQSMVINDYPERKLVIILPLVVTLIAIGFFSDAKGYWKRMQEEGSIRFVKLYWFAAYMLSFSVWIVYSFVMYRSPYFLEVKMALLLNLGVFITGSVFMVSYFLQGRSISRIWITLVLMLMLLPNIYLDDKYVYQDRTFFYRDAMIRMAEEVDGQILIGGCSFGFRLYNDSIPVLDWYNYYIPRQMERYDLMFDFLLAEGVGNYSLAYTQGENMDSPIEAGYMEKHGLRLVEEYELGDIFPTNMGLYLLQR